MTFAKATEILTAEELASRLILAGWKRKPCPECKGMGFHEESEASFTGIVPHWLQRWKCETCDGMREVWEQPVVK